MQGTTSQTRKAKHVKKKRGTRLHLLRYAKKCDPCIIYEVGRVSLTTPPRLLLTALPSTDWLTTRRGIFCRPVLRNLLHWWDNFWWLEYETAISEQVCLWRESFTVLVCVCLGEGCCWLVLSVLSFHLVLMSVSIVLISLGSFVAPPLSEWYWLCLSSS